MTKSSAVGFIQKPERRPLIDNVVYVVDAMMGMGKTSAAITYMNKSDPQQKFFFLTPFVDEGRRIEQACPARQFAVLEERRGSKLNDLRAQVQRGANIASTHALLSRYTPDILEGIAAGGYTLILDEAYAVTKTVTPSQKKAFLTMMSFGIINVDPETHWVSFRDGDTHGLLSLDQSAIKEVATHISAGSVYYYDNKLLIWVFPVEILQAFSKIIVLTYMFRGQSIYHYLDIYGFQFEYWGTKKVGEEYEFCAWDDRDVPDASIPSKIHILDNEKLNSIGDSERSLCSKWYSMNINRDDGDKVKLLARNIRNVQKHIYGCPASEFMWTTYKARRADIEDKNIKAHWVPCSEKATNKWRHKRYLAYAVNLFEHPDANDYFQRFGHELQVDDWALSEMIQWIWRSAIRDGQEIWIYIPSRRMRRLLTSWLASLGVKSGANLPRTA